MQFAYPRGDNHVNISEDAYKLFAGVSPETIELFGSMVGLDSQADGQSTEVYQTYLKLAKNNRSSMKRLIHRKGKGDTGDTALEAALKWASDEGIVAPQEVHFLQAQAQG